MAKKVAKTVAKTQVIPGPLDKLGLTEERFAEPFNGWQDESIHRAKDTFLTHKPNPKDEVLEEIQKQRAIASVPISRPARWGGKSDIAEQLEREWKVLPAGPNKPSLYAYLKQRAPSHGADAESLRGCLNARKKKRP